VSSLQRFVLAVAMAGCTKAVDEQQPPVVVPARDATVVDTAALTRHFLQCWEAYNTGSWGAYRACFAALRRFEQPGLNVLEVDEMIEDAKRRRSDGERAEVELVIGTDLDVIGVIRLGKRHVVEIAKYDDHGRMTRYERYYDAAINHSATPTMPAIATTRRVVIGMDTPAERQNYDIIERLINQWGRPGTKVFEDLLADDLSWSEPWFDKSLDRSRVLENMRLLRTGMDPWEWGVNTEYCAGDFVVVRGELSGNPRKAIPSMGITAPAVPKSYRRFEIPVVAIFKLANGKVVAASLLWQTTTLYEQLGVAPRTTPLSVSGGR
jgi:SnoaL-like domain